MECSRGGFPCRQVVAYVDKPNSLVKWVFGRYFFEAEVRVANGLKPRNLATGGSSSGRSSYPR